MKHTLISGCLLAAVVALMACGDSAESFGGFDPSIGHDGDPNALDKVSEGTGQAPNNTHDNVLDRVPIAQPDYGNNRDTWMAENLWVQMVNHQESWQQPSSRVGWVQGSPQHGSWQQLYQNGPDPLEDNYILVSRNYTSRDEGSLETLTVMKRVHGYDNDINDWFFARFLPNGDLDISDEGLPMAGRVGKGRDTGCVPCHSQASGGDFLHVFN